MGLTPDDVFETFKTHLENQPYAITCKECGANLGFDTSVDSDNDVIVEVQPCSKCMTDAKDEGHEEGHEEGLEQGKDEGREESA